MNHVIINIIAAMRFYDIESVIPQKSVYSYRIDKKKTFKKQSVTELKIILYLSGNHTLNFSDLKGSDIEKAEKERRNLIVTFGCSWNENRK